MIEPTNVKLAGLIGGTFDTTITLFEDTAQTEPFPTDGWTWSLTVDRFDTPFIDGTGLTLDSAAGSIAIKLTPEQTSTLEACVTHAVLSQTDESDDTNVYFPVTLDITWELP